MTRWHLFASDHVSAALPHTAVAEHLREYHRELKRGTLLDVPESSICIAFCRLGRASSVGLIDMVGLVRLHLRSAIARIHPLSIRQLEICHDTGSSHILRIADEKWKDATGWA